jgi:beta-galactosidase
VRVSGATSGEGRRLWFVSNWAWEPVTVPTPVAGTCLLSGRDVLQGGPVELGAWDVDIVAEA